MFSALVALVCIVCAAGAELVAPHNPVDLKTLDLGDSMLPPAWMEGGGVKMKLVFRNCQVRSTLFRYGYPQKLSLCLMNHGVFCGLLDQIHGVRSNLEILHAGENACLKLLTVERKK